MKIAICDDEQTCIDRLCTMINAYCTGRLLTCDCTTFTNPHAFGESDLASYDVVFLDANMGEVDGTFSTTFVFADSQKLFGQPQAYCRH